MPPELDPLLLDPLSGDPLLPLPEAPPELEPEPEPERLRSCSVDDGDEGDEGDTLPLLLPLALPPVAG